MPAPAAPTDFSYDRDIAPQASRFFNKIDADPSLSHEAKMRLQGSLLGGVEGIETQRLKLQGERDQGRARKLDYESSAFRLDEARAERARREQQASRLAGVNAAAKGILDGTDDPETKRQKLARTALDYVGDKDALDVFEIATKGLPETKAGGFTPSQIAGFTERIGDKVHPDDLPAVLSNPTLLGQVLHDIGQDEEAKKDAERIGRGDTEDAKRLRLDLAKAPLKFQRDEGSGEESSWLEPESTKRATTIVLALGTPAEQARFEALKGDASDHARADLIEKIQLREQLRVAQAAGGGGRKSASSVTGW